MGVRDDLEELPVAKVGVGDDQLVDPLGLEDRREILDVAEDGQIDAVRIGRERADELVVDPTARRAEGAMQMGDIGSRAGEERVPARSERPEHLARDEVVARPQGGDDDRAEEHGGRRQPVRGEIVARADREGQRDQRNDDQRRQDPPETGSPAALLVEARLREDENRDQGQERKPVGLDAPEHAPEDRRAAVVELAGHERRVEADDQPAKVDADERGDAGEPARRRRQLAAREKERRPRSDVGDDPRRRFVRAVRNGGGDATPPPLRCSYSHSPSVAGA